MSILKSLLEPIMNWCYWVCKNYGLAIILFTFISKIVLLPVSIWVQKNSIKMVKMQPEINYLKARHYGDKDTIAEEQAKIYKREKYNAFASLIPMIIQLVLLMGLIEVIKAGMLDSSINMDFFGVNLSLVPSEKGGFLVLSPILAGISALVMCICQNLSNVLQAEQNKLNQYGTMALSVCLSLYLGWLVPVGVAIYWIASNLFAVVQLYVLNAAINPKKYVDYEELEKSKKELDSLSSVGTKRKRFNDPEAKREREDYKKFNNVVNKKLVFYSESNGFYKYFKGTIEYIVNNTNITIHYITSDPGDNIFELAKSQPQIRPYYIGEKKLITLMMKMEADIVVMTMPDLNTYHIKRSYIKNDIEYIYIPHGMDSLNLTMRKGSMDYFDTIFCAGKHQLEEIQRTEEVYKLNKKKLIECGYPLLDEMLDNYETDRAPKSEIKNILIAPSWQPDNIVDSCLEQILDGIKGNGYNVVVRPHPQHVRMKAEKMEQLKQRYAEDKDVTIQTDFSSNDTVFNADLMISDWSGIAYEFAYTTKRPVLFINTPMKVMNAEYEQIGVVPLNIFMRDEIGMSLNTDEMDRVGESVYTLLKESDSYYAKIDSFVKEYVYNIGISSEVGAKYIINSLIEKKKQKS